MRIIERLVIALVLLAVGFWSSLHGNIKDTAPQFNIQQLGQLRQYNNTTVEIQEPKYQPRVLLYFTSFPKKQHLSMLQSCWPELLARSKVLRLADAIVFLGGKATDATLTEWRSAVNNLTVNATLYHDPLNPGYQPGAMRAMRVFVDKQWGRGYDWIIRLNPDTLIYNDTHLAHFFAQPSTAAVFANCDPSGKNTRVHTDFFAVRPEHIPAHAFADWKTHPNAETQATQVFRDLMQRQTYAWILPRNIDGGCRVRGNGLWHDHKTCSSALQNKPWDKLHIPAPSMHTTRNHIPKDDQRDA